MDSNKIIDLLGGTNAVADLCKVTKGAVSQWRSDGIPEARLMYLKLLRPDIFSPDVDRRDGDRRHQDAA